MRYGFPRRGREFNALCRGGSAALPPGLTLHPSRNEKSSSAVASQMQVIYERSGWASVDSVGERCRRASTASAVAQAHHTVGSLVQGLPSGTCTCSVRVQATAPEWISRWAERGVCASGASAWSAVGMPNYRRSPAWAQLMPSAGSVGGLGGTPMEKEKELW